jgi:hypothetical protein
MRNIGQYHCLGGRIASWLVDDDGPLPVQKLVIDRKKDFIEMPADASSSRPGPQPIGAGSAKLFQPVT